MPSRLYMQAYFVLPCMVAASCYLCGGSSYLNKNCNNVLKIMAYVCSVTHFTN